MENSSKKILYDEHVIHAERIINKLKEKAAEFDSNNPKHKDGKKYVISKKRYDHVLTIETWQLPEEIRSSVNEIITKKLVEI